MRGITPPNWLVHSVCLLFLGVLGCGEVMMPCSAGEPRSSDDALNGLTSAVEADLKTNPQLAGGDEVMR